MSNIHTYFIWNFISIDWISLQWIKTDRQVTKSIFENIFQFQQQKLVNWTISKWTRGNAIDWVFSIRSCITLNRYSKLIALYSPIFTIQFPCVFFFYAVQTSTVQPALYFTFPLFIGFDIVFVDEHTHLDTSIKSNSNELFTFIAWTTLPFSICWHFLIYTRLHAIDSSIFKRILIMNGNIFD